MSRLGRIFKAILRPLRTEFPRVGSVWVEKHSDPFELRQEMYEHPVHVIECAGSYVNIRIGHDSSWLNIRFESLHLWDFRSRYMPMEHARKRLERRGLTCTR